MAADLPVTQRE